MSRAYLPRTRMAVLVLGESMLLATISLASIGLRFYTDISPMQEYQPLLPKMLVLVFVIQLCLYYSDLYDETSLRWDEEFLRRLGRAFGAAALLLGLCFYAVPALKLGRGIMLIFGPLALVSVVSWRAAYRWIVGTQILTENLLILGSRVSAHQIAEELARRPALGYKLVGLLGEHVDEVGRRNDGPAVIGTTDDISGIVAEHQVNRVVVALEERRGALPIAQLLACRMAGVDVQEGSTFFESISGKILVHNLRPSWIVFSQGFRRPRVFRSAKRAFELALAALLLALTSPFLLILAALIRLESHGPALYFQERVGYRGSNFNLIKFRTMRSDAEAATGPVWAPSAGDARVTRFGRLLRKLRLDELPQLINVLRGEMSFVGPRPERPHFVETLRQVIPYYDERHTVRPGITGWAQVNYPYGRTIEDSIEKLQFDLFYVKHLSPALDILILLRTIKVAILGRGSA